MIDKSRSVDLFLSMVSQTERIPLSSEAWPYGSKARDYSVGGATQSKPKTLLGEATCTSYGSSLHDTFWYVETKKCHEAWEELILNRPTTRPIHPYHRPSPLPPNLAMPRSGCKEAFSENVEASTIEIANSLPQPNCSFLASSSNHNYRYSQHSLF